VVLKSKELYAVLAKKAMDALDIELSVRVWRELGDASMVLALQQIKYVEVYIYYY